MPNVTETATRFVNFVLGQNDLLSLAQAPVCLEVVQAAGFEPKAVVRGAAFRTSNDRALLNPLNKTCPFKVIGADDQGHVRATGWLENLCQFVRASAIGNVEKEWLANLVACTIKGSIPLQPIVLTSDGDTLIEFPPNLEEDADFPYFVDHVRDENDCTSLVGRHTYCGGSIYRHRTTITHDALVCKDCCLRATFPKHLRTYGQLREYFLGQPGMAHLRGEHQDNH